MRKQQYLALLLSIGVVSCAQAMDPSSASPLEQELKAEINKRTTDRVQEEIKVASTLSKSTKEEHRELQPITSTQEFLANVARCTANMDQAVAQLNPLLAQQEALKAEGAKHASTLATLTEEKKPLEDQMTKLTGEKRTLINRETKITLKKQAIQRLVAAYLEFAMHEPLLEKMSGQQLTPILAAELESEKQELAKKIANIAATWKALNAQFIPICEQQKKVVANREQNTTALVVLSAAIHRLSKEKEDAEREKTNLFEQIEKTLEATIEAKQKLEDEIPAIRAAITEEKKC